MDDWVGEKLTGEPARRKPPGPVILVLATVTVAIWVCLQRNWWPSPFGQFAWLDPLLVTPVVFLVLLALGLVWSVRALYVLLADRRWSWWILPAPFVVCAGVTVVALLPPLSILDERAEFESVALDLRGSPGSVREEFEIGPFDIRRAQEFAPGEVYFFDDDSFLTTSTGWVYSPDGEPTGFDDFTATHLDGPWYEFTAVWRD